jgi:hypothetical protein
VSLAARWRFDVLREVGWSKQRIMLVDEAKRLEVCGFVGGGESMR